MDSKLKGGLFLTIIIVWMLLAPLFGQTILAPLFYGQGGAASYPAITIDGSVHGSAVCAGSQTTCTVDIGTPTAGDTIDCDIVFNHNATYTATLVSDNVNSGQYQPFISRIRETSGTNYYANYYKENVAASDTTITLTIGSAQTNSAISCRAIKGVPSTYSADSSVAQSVSATGTNPANGNSYTPAQNNSIVFSGMQSDSGTVTAGSGFQIIDTVSRLFPQYQIQTTATGTTGPFNNGTSSLYAIGMSAFGQNHAGSCGATMVGDWNGGMNGATPATADVQASQHGGQKQPNCVNSTKCPQVVVVNSGTGLTYNTSAYQAFPNSITCPFYSGSGTGTNTLGLDHAGGGGTGQVAIKFETTQDAVSFAVCVSTTATAVAGKSLDTLSITGGDITGGLDYVLLQWNGSSNKWVNESKCGSTTSTNTWSTNQQYLIMPTFHRAGQHTIDIYTGCGNNPTHLETITAACSTAGGGYADNINLGYAGNDTWATGHWYFGAYCVDILNASCKAAWGIP